jgi:hypothetical protein
MKVEYTLVLHEQHVPAILKMLTRMSLASSLFKFQINICCQVLAQLEASNEANLGEPASCVFYEPHGRPEEGK